MLGVLEFCQKKRSNNTSGVPGVHFADPGDAARGRLAGAAQAGGRHEPNEVVLVLKHGFRKAYRLAVAARREMLRRADDRPYLYDPHAKRIAAQPADRQTV